MMQISWWKRWDQPPPFYASAADESRIITAFPGRCRIMVFCEDRRHVIRIDWGDIKIVGGEWSARRADLILEMKPCGFVYVVKDRFGKSDIIRSICDRPRQ